MKSTDSMKTGQPSQIETSGSTNARSSGESWIQGNPTLSILRSSVSIPRIMQLQRTVGNRAVTKMLQGVVPQQQRASSLDGAPVIQMQPQWNAEDMRKNLIEVAPEVKLEGEVESEELKKLRKGKVGAFDASITTALEKSTPSEQAALLSNNIKSGQYFHDGNTRVSTAAIFRIYESVGNKKLNVSPLQVLAAVGEAEINSEFDIAKWLEQAEQDSDRPQEVPNKNELYSIHGRMAAIKEADNRLQCIVSKLQSFRNDRQYMTRDEAKEEYAITVKVNQERGYSTQSFEKEYEEMLLFESYSEREKYLVDNKLDLNEVAIWAGRDNINKAVKLLKPVNSPKPVNLPKLSYEKHFFDEVDTKDTKAIDVLKYHEIDDYSDGINENSNLSDLDPYDLLDLIENEIE